MGRTVRKLGEILAGVTRLAVDTAPWIYFVEKHPDHTATMREILRRAEAGEFELVTSTLTVTEVLTLPFRQGQVELAETYKAILFASPHLEIVPVDVKVAEQAARLRATSKSLKTPDSIQLAVAIEAGCEAFLTNDHRLSAFRGFPLRETSGELSVVQLADLEL